ncbi:retrovirus-related pol polyprotein from transposon TNT 1-94 [Tanacetum coccineum]
MVTKFDIDKFDGKISFAIWKVHMQAVLTYHGYKKAPRSLAHKPQGMSDKDWLELDEKALATIQLFLTREVLREVLHETTATGTSVQDHLDEFNTILIGLRNLDVDIDDEDKAILLVISLPASYKHFKEIMLYGNRETLSFIDVKSALLSKQKYDDDVDPESGEGLNARGQSSDWGESSNKNKKNQSQSRGKYSNKSCKYCKKLGHVVSDCYKLKNKLEREGKGNNEKKPEKSAKVAIAKGDSDGDVYLAIDTKKSRDELIIDSGCTFHMTPHQSWFSTYESFNGGNVYMGNHTICTVIGKGNIQVKILDGGVRTITGVRYVPDLKRNLISLSTLEANGYHARKYDKESISLTNNSLDTILDEPCSSQLSTLFATSSKGYVESVHVAKRHKVGNLYLKEAGWADGGHVIACTQPRRLAVQGKGQWLFENDPHDGNRKCEALWPIFKIAHQQSRYIFDLYHRRKEISAELFEFCLD